MCSSRQPAPCLSTSEICTIRLGSSSAAEITAAEGGDARQGALPRQVGRLDGEHARHVGAVVREVAAGAETDLDDEPAHGVTAAGGGAEPFDLRPRHGAVDEPRQDVLVPPSWSPHDASVRQ